MTRRTLAALPAAVLALVGLLVLAPAPSAGAQTTTVIDQAVAAFRTGETVYVHPDAERAGQVSSAAQRRMRERIKDGSRAVFVAVLPRAAAGEAGGDVNRLPGVLHQRLGFAGTYAVLAGDSFRAASSDLQAGRAASIATDSFQDKGGDGPGAVLETFVDRVERVSGSSSGSGDGSGSGSGSGGTSWVGVFLVVALVGGGLWLFARRRRAVAAENRELESVRSMLRADLDVLGNDVLSLEPDITLHPDARDEYEAAVSRFKFASEVIDRVRAPEDVGRVRRVLAEGHYAMARAKAVIDNREPPPPPPELSEPGPQGEPPVVVHEGAPAYAGHDGGWYGGGGWFGGSNGLLTGLLLGQMLGGGVGHGGYGGGWGGGSGGWGGGSGGSDPGGGDFGGGDFGGGGFGGGDFGGGGDVGGGDF